VGTARTALYNYLYARKHKGTFILRLEDTDEERSKEEYTQDIVDGLRWLGLQWDEGLEVANSPYPPYRQTDKIDHYQQYANHLISSADAYLAYETPEELEELKSAQEGGPRYDNRGRHLSQEEIDRYTAEGRIPMTRFKVEEPRVVTWHDLIKGEIAIDTSDLGGDMVIVKSNGVAIYNFAVVIDDVDMKMTHVIRGEDHIHNTAKQILIYEALGKELPQFAHVPLIFDIERKKLSKRKHGESVHINYYRKLGYMPEAIVNYLAQMSWTAPDEKEIFTLEEACEMFDLNKVSKSPAVFDIQRLNWYNSHYIRSLPLSVITERSRAYLEGYDLSEFNQEKLEELVGSVRGGLTMLSEITAAVKFVFDKKIEFSEEVKQVLKTETSQKVLSKTLESVSKMPWGDQKGCKAIVDAVGKEIAVKGKELYWPLRAALSGSVQGPDLGAMLSVLGEKRVKARLEEALPLCRSCN
jgi:glutamyl-tRNA synthetase